jgi:hypothetical protein
MLCYATKTPVRAFSHTLYKLKMLKLTIVGTLNSNIL